MIFITNELITGGVEKALLSMIKQMPREKYDITIGVCRAGGELEKNVDKNIKIIEIPEINKSIKSILNEELKKRSFISFIRKIKNLIMCNLLNDYNEKCVYRSKLYKKLNGKYDIAICYHKPTDLPVAYVINNIDANKKILWIHMEVGKITENEKRGYRKLYSQYDQIICISKAIKRQLIDKFPEFKDKTKVVYNFIDTFEIMRLGKDGEKFNEQDDYFKILTVARLSPEKGHLLVIEAANKLKENGVNFKWYLVGEGPFRDTILEKIGGYNLKENIILLGNKKNPYGYFKTCDIYVQPSFEEGFGITVSEAKIFKKPIILTNFATAREHIIDKKTGYIVGFNGDEIAYRLEELINNRSIMEKFQANLNCNTIANK